VIPAVAASTALQPNGKTRRRAALGNDPPTSPNTTRTPPNITRADGCDQPKPRLETSPAIPGSCRELTPPGFAVPRSLGVDRVEGDALYDEVRRREGRAARGGDGVEGEEGGQGHEGAAVHSHGASLNVECGPITGPTAVRPSTLRRRRSRTTHDSADVATGPLRSAWL
jgi:hypothetical protein